jgi:hypothetical protein
VTAFQEVKLAIVSATGLSRDALHVYLGLTVLFAAAIVLRQSLRSVIPWLIVLLAAVLLELGDLHDDLGTLGHWRWMASVHDIVNTLFWPTILLFLARNRTLFGSY